MKKYIVLLLFILTGFKMNAQLRFVDEVFSGAPKVTRDIIYGSNQDYVGQTVNITLDFYEPQNDTMAKRPLIIVAHEGSFLFGDKDDDYMVKYANKMVKRGYTVACITYRKGWAPNPAGSAEDNTRLILPAAWRAIQDYKAAIRFFRKDAATANLYKIDPEKIAGGGFGAGAYLPINGQIIDEPIEFQLASMRQKNSQNQPTNTPYIDTTRTDLGGIADTRSGSPGYSFKLPVCLIYSGAILDTLMFDAGKNPIAIAAHGEKDETTPYKTAIVNAQVAPNALIPIVKVHGTYQVTRVLDNKGVNTLLNKIDYDKFPQYPVKDSKFGPLVMYKKGVLTFLNQTYMPWDSLQEGYEQSSKFYMDSLVRYTAPRLAYALNLVELKDVSSDPGDTTGNSIATLRANAFEFYPNPANSHIRIVQNQQEKLQTIELFSIDGRLVKTFTEKDFDSNLLPIEELNKGAYLIKFNAKNGILTKSLIKF